MTDIADYKQRIAALAEGLDLTEDSGYELLRESLVEAFEATPFVDLREIARALGSIRSASSRASAVENIVDAWVALDPADRVAPTHTDADVRDILDEIALRAGTAALLFGSTGFTAAVASLRSAVDALPTE